LIHLQEGDAVASLARMAEAELRSNDVSD
jgi:hypothetical protein